MTGRIGGVQERSSSSLSTTVPGLWEHEKVKAEGEAYLRLTARQLSDPADAACRAKPGRDTAMNGGAWGGLPVHTATWTLQEQTGTTKTKNFVDCVFL